MGDDNVTSGKMEGVRTWVERTFLERQESCPPLAFPRYRGRYLRTFWEALTKPYF